MLVFEDSEVRNAFDHRGRVRSTGRYHKGECFLAVGGEFFLPGLGSACTTVIEGNKGALGSQPGVLVKFETHRRKAPLSARACIR